MRCAGFLSRMRLYWIRDFHVDILRLDAVHAIVDTSAKPFLRELNAAVEAAASELEPRNSSHCGMRSQRYSYGATRRSEEATASRPSGTTIFITPCTPFSPAKPAGITRISVDVSQIAKSLNDRLCLSGRIFEVQAAFARK